MSALDITLWQFILAVVNTVVVLVGGGLAVLGYRKIIKSTDENARMRQQEIEKAGDTMQSVIRANAQTLKDMSTRTMIGMGAMAIILGALMIIDHVRMRRVEKTFEHLKR